MDKKILYSYDDKGELQEYTAYVKMNIRSGFEISDVSKRQEMIEYLNKTYIKSHIYPEQLLHSDKPLPKGRLYFERKDICSALKGNSCIFKFSSSSSILGFMTMINDKAKTYLEEINTYNSRLQHCLKTVIEYLSIVVSQDFSPKIMELSEILLNLKNICIYIIEEVIDGLVDILFTIKQLQVSFLYNIDTTTKSNSSILLLINEMNDLEKRMKEIEVAILFKKISLDDYKEDTEIDNRIQEILELPETEMHKQLQLFLEDEIKANLDEEEENSKYEEEDESQIEDSNIFLICEDKDSPKLSIRMTIEFLELELEKISTLII